MACLLAVLRLKRYVAISPPRTCYPAAGLPSGAGFPPAGLRDLARPHVKDVPPSYNSDRLCFNAMSTFDMTSLGIVASFDPDNRRLSIVRI